MKNFSKIVCYSMAAFLAASVSMAHAQITDEDGISVEEAVPFFENDVMFLPDAGDDRYDDQAPVEGGGRFIERKGTGSSSVVLSAPEAKPPAQSPAKGHPSRPSSAESAQIDHVYQSIQAAGAEGGKKIDSALVDINLPGLKRDDPSLKPWVLHTRNGVNELVNLSSSFINRIATPFKNPILIDSSNSASKTIGSDIYYGAASGAPIGVFIVDGDNQSQVISLTVMPVDNIPAQNVIIKMEDLRVTENLIGKGGVKERPNRPSDYQGHLRSIMTQAIQGKIDGFTIVPLEAGKAKLGTIEVEPDIVFAGAYQDVYRYRLKNPESEPIDLVEPAFFRDGIRAISFFPKSSLQPGESTYVFLLADKSMAGNVVRGAR